MKDNHTMDTLNLLGDSKYTSYKGSISKLSDTWAHVEEYFLRNVLDELCVPFYLPKSVVAIGVMDRGALIRFTPHFMRTEETPGGFSVSYLRKSIDKPGVEEPVTAPCCLMPAPLLAAAVQAIPDLLALAQSIREKNAEFVVQANKDLAQHTKEMFVELELARQNDPPQRGPEHSMASLLAGMGIDPGGVDMPD